MTHAAGAVDLQDDRALEVADVDAVWMTRLLQLITMFLVAPSASLPSLASSSTSHSFSTHRS